MKFNSSAHNCSSPCQSTNAHVDVLAVICCTTIVGVAVLLGACSTPKEEPLAEVKSASAIHSVKPDVELDGGKMGVPVPKPEVSGTSGTTGKVVKTGLPVALHSRVRIAGQGHVPFAEVGDPLQIVYEKQATGTKPVIVYHAGFWVNHRIVVLDASGQSPPLTPFGLERVAAFSPRGARRKNASWELKPGVADSSEGNYDLTKLFVLATGHYSVQVNYEDDIEVSSNTLQFGIVPKGTRDILDKLNAWHSEETDVFERPHVYKNQISSGETNGFLSVHKDALDALGVQVQWDVNRMKYHIQLAAQ